MKPPANQIGLKLWAPNVGGYLTEARRLYGARQLDYVELYTSPDCASHLPAWKAASLPYVIHCAHSLHGFNLSDPAARGENQKLFAEAVFFFRELGARGIIVHPGILGQATETVAQLQILMKEFGIAPHQIWVENKPFINLNHQLCVGGSPESMALIKKGCETGIVLDVGHAIKYAIGAGRDWQPVLHQMMTLEPEMLHVSDAKMSHPLDEHLHFGAGEFDFDTIFSICDAPYISIETIKDHPERLEDFVNDVGFLKRRLAARKL